MSDFVSIECSICGNDDTQLISKKGQFGLPVNVVICKCCGLSYLNPRWPKEKYMDFYKNEYDRFYRPEILNNKKVKEEGNNPIVERIIENKIFNQPPKNILDIGSGEGKNLKALKTHFNEAELFAIEPSSTSNNLLKNMGANVIGTDVENDWHQNYPEKFDLIIMRHVLEHLMDPINTLRNIRKTLSENGIIYIAVPNNLTPRSHLESHWFRVVHTYYFNKYSLKNTCTKIQLNPILIQEGDKYNRGELFAFANKSKEPLTFSIDEKHFIIQKDVFSRTLKKQNNKFYLFSIKLVKFVKRNFS